MSAEIQDKVDEKEHEILERQNRENNVIIFKLNEPNTNIIAERQGIDLDSVNKMIDIMYTENEQEVAVEKNIRLGARAKNYIQNPRPIIVSFTNLEGKKSFLGNSQALRDCEDENVKKVSVANDLTKQDRKKKLNLLILEGEKRGRGGPMEICNRGQKNSKASKALTKVSNLKFIYTNCDTVTNKLDEVEASIDMNDPDIVVLTEILPKNNGYMLQTSELEIRGYSLFTNNYELKGIRGVAIFVKKCLTANQVHTVNCADDTVWIELKTENKKKMIIGGIYRSPNSSKERDEQLWGTLLSMANTYIDNMLVMGDFNCGGINWIDVMSNEQNLDALSNKLIEVLRDCFLEQVITENTSARGTNIPSLIDLVLCYDREIISNVKYLIPLGKSDHCIITCNAHSRKGLRV